MKTILAHLIETSLEFRYYRGSSTETTLSSHLHSHPFMVVGQIKGNGLTSQIEGEGECTINDGDGYCFPAGCRMRSQHHAPHPATFHWAHIDFFICNGVHLSRVLDFPNRLALKKGKDIGRINRRLADLHQQETDTLSHIIERKQLGMELLHILISDCTYTANSKRLRAFVRVQAILEHMHQHLADPLQAQNIAKLFQLSFSRFHELFTEATGIPPGQYQLQLRLQHAHIQLASTNYPIKDIAASVGFHDNHYFSRIFKKTYKMTPSDYRKNSGIYIL